MAQSALVFDPTDEICVVCCRLKAEFCGNLNVHEDDVCSCEDRTDVIDALSEYVKRPKSLLDYRSWYYRAWKYRRQSYGGGNL